MKQAAVVMAGFQRGHRIVGPVSGTPPASHSSCSPSCIPYSFGGEGTMEKVSFDNTADSDQCRPRGWHHQLQIAPPPSLAPSEELVIAPTRASGRSGLGKEAPLFALPPVTPFFSLNLIMRSRTDRSHFHNWARARHQTANGGVL